MYLFSLHLFECDVPRVALVFLSPVLQAQYLCRWQATLSRLFLHVIHINHMPPAAVSSDRFGHTRGFCQSRRQTRQTGCFLWYPTARKHPRIAERARGGILETLQKWFTTHTHQCCCCRCEIKFKKKRKRKKPCLHSCNAAFFLMGCQIHTRLNKSPTALTLISCLQSELHQGEIHLI